MILIVILMIIFAMWRLSGDSLNVNKVQTFRGEMFYWMAILFSNTLGTALGDFLADDSGWALPVAPADRLDHCRGGGAQILHPDFVGAAVLGGVRADPAVRCDPGRLPDQTHEKGGWTSAPSVRRRCWRRCWW
jgi:hypothetical protein